MHAHRSSILEPVPPDAENRLRDLEQEMLRLRAALDASMRDQRELADFFENAAMPLHWVGPDGTILRANQAELDLLGYRQEEYAGRHIAEFHADPPVIEDILRRLGAGEVLRDCPARLRCKDGSIRDVLITSSVYWDGDRFIHTRCLTRDITELRRAEQARQENERRFREMIDALPAAIYTTDAEGRLTHFNPAAVEFSGRVPELGTDHWCVSWKMFRPDGTPLPHEECPMAVALKEGRVPRGVEAIAERPDGTRIWFKPYPTPLHDAEGRIVGGINMLVDITEQKQTEQALRESEERFRTLVSVITDIAWATDASGAFVTRQSEWERYTGQTWEEHRGIGWADALHPDDRAAVRQKWEQACTAGALYEASGRLWHAQSQQYRHFEARATPLRNPDGTIRAWVGSCTDVHDRELAEAALRSTERMEAVGRLAGGVAHEANNQMTVVLGCAEFALRRPDLPGGLREEILNIRRAGERTAAITSQLLAFGRRQLLRPEPVNLNAILESFAPILERTLGEGCELVLHLTPELSPVLADRGQVEQVLVNLTFNARDAMPEGGRLTIETRPTVLTEPHPGSNGEEPLPAGNYGVLTVRDTGHGMGSDTLARIFEPFFTTKPVGQGSGLGLSSVYGIVRQLNGDIRVESTQGAGTTFEIYIPVADSSIRPPDEPMTEAGSAAGTVLVVEDEPIVRLLAVRALRAEGFEVLEAEHGQAALELLAHHRGSVQAVVADVAMPIMGGRLLAERLMQSYPGVPVLLMSGYTSDELVRRGMLASGTAPLLPKPFDPATLVERVRALVEAIGDRAAG